MNHTHSNISNEAVHNATGRTWAEWFALLDTEGAAERPHKEIAAWLIEMGHIKSGWWAQSVTVAYEYYLGRRVKGETADVGFQMGVQKTLPIEASHLWDFLTSPAGLETWLGSGLEDLMFAPGETYWTNGGTVGEIRSVYPAKKLRLTWQPAGWDNASTLQLALQDKGEKTTLRFHQEKLTGPEQRRQMKDHWREVLKTIRKKAK